MKTPVAIAVGVVVVLVIILLILFRSKLCTTVVLDTQRPPVILTHQTPRPITAMFVERSAFIQKAVKISEIKVWADLNGELVNIINYADPLVGVGNIDSLKTSDPNDRYDSGSFTDDKKVPMIGMMFVSWLGSNPSAVIKKIEFVNADNLQDAAIFVGDESQRSEYWALHRAPNTSDFTINV